MAWNAIRKLFGMNNQNHQIPNNDRESVRYNITLFARYKGKGTFTERRGNVGIGGFCFEGVKEYELGTPVDLLFRLPGTSSWIHASGIILGHSHSYGWLGIRGCFTDISFENERLLARWLDSTTLELQLAAA
jgi:hypothetical protein